MNIRRAAIIAFAVIASSPVSAGVTKHGDFRIEYKGTDRGPYSNLDDAVEAWMRANNIHAGQLAVRNKGNLIFSHAYTLGKSYELVTTSNVFRLISISKMLVTAAYSKLLQQGKLTGSERVYKYLGIKKALLKSQTIDPRSQDITVQELFEHTSGLPGAHDAGDPQWRMRDIELQLGQAPLSENQFAQYLYGLKLNSDPGTTMNYSNVGYFLLGEVVQKAAKQPYFTYVKKSLLAPLGMKNWLLTPTSHTTQDPLEVFADDPRVGPSVFDLSDNPEIDSITYEGANTIWEIGAAPIDAVTNAESVSLFVHNWNAFGLGGRNVGSARSGCLDVGAATWTESLNADIDYSVNFNKQPCLDFSSSVISQIRTILQPL
jgi:CubicO group peptidase (beta-lactamase class C family)